MYRGYILPARRKGIVQIVQIEVTRLLVKVQSLPIRFNPVYQSLQFNYWLVYKQVDFVLTSNPGFPFWILSRSFGEKSRHNPVTESLGSRLTLQKPLYMSFLCTDQKLQNVMRTA